MLLENILATSFGIFLLMIIVVLVSMLSRFSLYDHRWYDSAIMVVLALSGSVSGLASIWWIVRAWG